MSEVKRRMDELCEAIARHDNAYFVQNKPTITDEVYDQMLVELRNLESEFPDLRNPNSPTSRVGSDLESTFDKVQHRSPMLSLEKAFSTEEIIGHFVHAIGEDFDPDIDVVVEPKIDGLSLALRYVDGNLVMATTRGDGTTGDDVTANARTIKSIPTILTVDPKIGRISTTIEVRGEVCMSRKTFAELNEERLEAGLDAFANPRNAASGTMKLKDSREVAKRRLSFVAYQLFQDDDVPSVSQNSLLGTLSLLGFTIPKTKNSRLDPDQIDKILAYQAEHRNDYPYDIDGLVIKIDSTSIQRELGLGTTTPKWAVAYKFPAERKVAKLLDIELTVGRTGQITPNARIQPIQLAGTTVKNASLGNIDEILRMKINVGDEIIIQKAGEIIPQVVGVVFEGIHVIEGSGLEGQAKERFDQKPVWTMPVECPSCKTAIRRDGVHYFCTNTSCNERQVQYLIYAFGKGCLDCDGLGEAQARTLVENGCSSILGVLKFPEDQVCAVFKKAASKKFLAQREKIKEAPLWRKIKAMGIDGIGTTMAKELSARWSNIADMVEKPEDLPEVIGIVNAASFVRWVEANIDEVVGLQEAGFVFSEERKTGPLSGSVFCITGAMASGTRDFVAHKIEENGGAVKDSVGRKVNYLVSGDGGGRNKAEAARKYGTKVITEAELYTMMGFDGVPVGGGQQVLLREMLED